MHVSLIVPAPCDAVSGGYAYDRRIVAGLREAGHTVQVVELSGSHPLADAAARDAAFAAWTALPDTTRPIIDGLGLPAFAGMDDVLAARHAVGLIHHPTALETGFSESDRAALLAIERRLLPRLARVIVTSGMTGERLAVDFGVAPERIAVVVPGTDDAPRSAGSGGPTCRIISVGTLVRRKGHDVLLRAVARLFDLDWQLTIVGSPDRDPVYARTLMALAEELDIADDVRFAGEVDDAALEELWRAADLFALATNWEGYGMAVAEALKRGLPVAVCSGGAAGSLVTPEAGVSCPPGDHINLSKALRRLIFGAGLRHVMADAAWQVGQSLPNWKTQAREFAQAMAGG
ncbi:MAG TPA: glycosyltransferase family 4 protein [Acetobacteraceae bacterium]|nr:glycosyltransferase family 4 protein [Acetobacteraceae bacterium]